MDLNKTLELRGGDLVLFFVLFLVLSPFSSEFFMPFLVGLTFISGMGTGRIYMAGGKYKKERFVISRKNFP